jgi:hypothetical protein
MQKFNRKSRVEERYMANMFRINVAIYMDFEGIEHECLK